MRIREEIVKKHWHDAAVEELATKYVQQGYVIYKDEPIGDYLADLVAKKEHEFLVFEVKSGDWSTEKTRQVQQTRNAVVHQLGGKFNLVLASLPQEESIEIEAIETILFNLLIEEPGKLTELSTDTTVEDVSDVIVTAINVEKSRIRVTGSGVVTVSLADESNSDKANLNGQATSGSFPFDFEILLGGDLHLIAVENFEIDLPVYSEV